MNFIVFWVVILFSVALPEEVSSGCLHCAVTTGMPVTFKYYDYACVYGDQGNLENTQIYECLGGRGPPLCKVTFTRNATTIKIDRDCATSSPDEGRIYAEPCTPEEGTCYCDLHFNRRCNWASFASVLGLPKYQPTTTTTTTTKRSSENSNSQDSHYWVRNGGVRGLIRNELLLYFPILVAATTYHVEISV